MRDFVCDGDEEMRYGVDDDHGSALIMHRTAPHHSCVGDSDASDVARKQTMDKVPEVTSPVRNVARLRLSDKNRMDRW